MATFEVTSPSGQRLEVTAPDGANEAQVLAYVQAQHAAGSPSVNPTDAAMQAARSVMTQSTDLRSPVVAKTAIDNDAISQGARAFPNQGSGLSQAALNLLAGGVRGAGSIGATLMAPIDVVSDLASGKGLTLDSNHQRRADMDAALQDFGAQPDSLAYGAGKIGAEVAGTLPVGGILGKGAAAVLPQAGVSAPVANAISEGLTTGGFRVGGATGVGGLAARAATGAATGAASAGLVDPSQAGLGAAIGGAIPVGAKVIGSTLSATGNAAKSGIAALVQKIGGQIDPQVADLAAKAEALGIKVPVDRLLDSKPLDALGASLAYVPLSGRTATEEQMSLRMNQALSNLIGEDTPNMTQAVRNAQLKLGNKFGAFLQSHEVNIDQQFVNDLADVATSAHSELSADGASIIQRQIDNLIAKSAGGTIGGDAAYNAKRVLDKISARNSPEAAYAIDLKKSLLSALDRSVKPDEAAGFAQLRRQYGTMLDLERIAPNGAVGEISAAKLAGLKDINNPKLQDLADIAQQFIKPREGAHGAAQRVIGAQGALGTGGALVGGIPGVVLTTGTTVGLGRAANAVLNSDAVRDAVLQRASSTAVPAITAKPLGIIGSAMRTAPVLGAAALTSDAYANQSDEGVGAIMNATNLNDAVLAAQRAASGVGR